VSKELKYKPLTIADPPEQLVTSLINLDQFWADSRFSKIKGQGYATVIIDTGADLDHPFFGADADNNGIADKIVYQYDFADNDGDASDRNSHGSHVTSIAAQIAPDANLIILKVFGDRGSGTFADLEEALQWVNLNADTYNIAAVNLSVGDGQNWTSEIGRYGIGDELAVIASQNILVAAAAGNSFYTFNSTPGLAYPAADPNAISVGAVWAGDFGYRTFRSGAVDYSTDTDRIASFSQRHPLLDVFAPGVLITGANASGGTIAMGGTSQATPYITGIATLAQQIAQEYLGRKLTLSEFKTLLDTTSDIIIDGDDEDDNVINTGESYPRINVLALAEGILTLNNTGPEVEINNGLSLDEGESQTITNSQLKVIDADNSAREITYTLTDIPDHGRLTLDGGELIEGNSFTQDDIDNNRLSYTHNGSETTDDGFSFTVSDGEGGNIGETLFDITVNPLVDTIEGTTGSDNLMGTSGDDRITGYSGSDRLTGNGGSDTYRYLSYRDARDTITDFANDDFIDLSSIFASSSYGSSDPFSSYVRLVAAGTNMTDVQINPVGDSRTIYRSLVLLQDMTPSELTANNFIV
jgi:hypothetical protein